MDAASRLTESGGTEDETLQSLVLDLLEWVGPVARPYDEVMGLKEYLAFYGSRVDKIIAEPKR